MCMLKMPVMLNLLLVVTTDTASQRSGADISASCFSNRAAKHGGAFREGNYSSSSTQPPRGHSVQEFQRVHTSTTQETGSQIAHRHVGAAPISQLTINLRGKTNSSSSDCTAGGQWTLGEKMPYCIFVLKTLTQNTFTQFKWHMKTITFFTSF